MSESGEVHAGSCLCGSVRYQVRGPLGHMDHCHCVHCRKSHGAAFATYIEVPWEALDILAGRDALTTYAADSGTKRSFCRTCGANILCYVDGDRIVEVTAGTLDTPVAVRPQSHIFVRSKVEWFDIRDEARQYQTTRPYER
jgi:hypothetical protein